jgi:hypothetical protein
MEIALVISTYDLLEMDKKAWILITWEQQQQYVVAFIPRPLKAEASMKDKDWINTRVIQNEAHCKALLFMVSPSNYCQLPVHHNCLSIGLVLDLTQVLLVEIQQFFVWLHCCTVYFVRWMFQNISIFPILKTITSYIELRKKERAGIMFLQDWSIAMSLVKFLPSDNPMCLVPSLLN